MSSPVVVEGESVLLQLNDGSRIFAEAMKGRNVRLRDVHFNAASLIGQAYGSVFEVDGRNLERVESGELTPSISLDADMDTNADNRDLVDTNTSQGLSAEEIAAMKSDGVGGAAIIQALKDNSSTFATKTAFSQEKWLRKKHNKYLRRFRIVRCTALRICEVLMASAPEKISWLRADSLAQMLSRANVQAGARVMVFDGISGLLTGAVAERMAPAAGAGGDAAPSHAASAASGGAGVAASSSTSSSSSSSSSTRSQGYIVSPHEDNKPIPNYHLLNRFNLSPAARQALMGLRYSELTSWAAAVAAIAAAPPPAPGAMLPSSSSSGSGSGSSSNSAAASTDADQPASKRRRVEESAAAAAEVAAVEAAAAADGGSDDDDGAAEEAEDGAAADGGAGAGAGGGAGVKRSREDRDAGGGGAQAGGAGGQSQQSRGKGKAKEKAPPLPSLPDIKPWPYTTAQKQQVLADGMDSLLIATPYLPEPLMLAALRYMRPGSTFAVFSPDATALGILFRRLRVLGVAVAMELAETWYREYQVLPDRTHPTMSMHGASGYILSGTLIQQPYSVVRPPPPPPAPVSKYKPREKPVKAAAASHTTSAPLDVALMRLACDEAVKCESVQTAYNVGAVLARLPVGAAAMDAAAAAAALSSTAGDRIVVSTGYSRELPGNTHAEECALAKAGANTDGSTSAEAAAGPGPAAGLCMYTTMEPCSERLSGKLPCAARLIAAGVARVVLAVLEPAHFVTCKGVQQLQQAGIEVLVVDDETCKARATAANAHIATKTA